MDNPSSSPSLPLLKPPSTFTCWQSSPISTIAQFDGQDGMKRSTLGFNGWDLFMNPLTQLTQPLEALTKEAQHKDQAYEEFGYK
ncbi:hypothetical protein Tco_0840732 [Tanacetum coccineum]|uniref:Uncharacterized protein n=1 Tax=Tanacetum coccineum TaxID=301880 RepID=A0ABQ5AUT8_9ASTR